ncbi:nitrogen permease regulator of amino acid transport activity 3-domain-containing protein [Alternaria rosae]|uniref:nitrogen permease regulator of amino acid transport activity 3-domain-containing protein n=1 Tax=Alternaria rosae TaxID=1187941 RepID=UPI001E8D5CA7|nr:nitrogen permease regulator of amino acid transport activity 3-domain-containing protein [Alternaria rosae]KAH6861214.1 nitrogen permease regulator of amino acid transport activity 3-domain-containing protein [Alternaria rosae]
MAVPLPPASNLHAILLVTKSRSLGPRLVFHYPPLSPSAAALAAAKDPAWFRHDTSTASVDSRSSDSEWDSSTDSDDDNDIEIGSRTSGGRASGRTLTGRVSDKSKLGSGLWGKQETIDEEDADDDNEQDGNGHRGKGGDHDWDTVLGFKMDALEKMLSPSKEYNKRRFELGVESIVFLGAPMFVRDDGLWKKAKRKKKKRSDQQKLEDGDLVRNLTSASDDDDANSPEPPTKPAPEKLRMPEGYEPGYGHDSVSSGPSEAGSDARSNSTSLDINNPDMTMFNVVFVLNPPALEYQQRVKEMYENVTRKYAKALKYEEARFQYVWKESKRIIDIKQRAKETNESLTATWRKIVSTSPLAKSIAIMFDAISHDKIAHIHFDATFNTSFQIPQADSTPYLPTAIEPQMPGLWLTTSNVILEDDDAPMTQHAALLLLEDAEVLIKDLGGDTGGNAAAIAFYIRNIIPTKSLLKISKKHNISAHDMEYIASHLVYWRRARLVAPLSPRDTYIVSPNADMTVLPAAISVYAQRFPTLPTLPKVLSMLSGTPRPYRNFIPTAEHREAYMEILAWLMRGGWVTQLRTFAWVRVTPEIKAQVAAEMEHEERIKKAEEARRELMSDNDSVADSLLSDKRSSLLSLNSARTSSPLRRTRRDADEEMESSTILSPRLGSTAMSRSVSARTSSDAGSTSSQRTTIALTPSQRAESPSHLGLRDVKPHRPSPLHLKPTSPSPSRNSIVSPTSPVEKLAPPDPSSFAPTTILSPQKASSTEARWLDKIAQTFEDTAIISTNPSPPKHADGGLGGITGKELRESWPMLLRHLDGKHAIEDVSAREGIKRKRVAVLFNAVKERGWLVIARHW